MLTERYEEAIVWADKVFEIEPNHIKALECKSKIF